MDEKVTAVEKTLEILLAFGVDNRPIGTSELSKKLGYHKATTSRILLTLAAYGFVSQDTHSKKFSLGATVYELGARISENSVNKIVRIARPHIAQLRDLLDETIVLEVWTGNRTIVAYEEESNRPLKVSGQVGVPPPIHVTAGAKAILSHLDPAQADTSLKGRLKKFTENTVTDRAAIKANLARYKLQGFATDKDEFDEGISAVGMPIFDDNGLPIAALVVLTPSLRFTEDPQSPTLLALKVAVDSISTKLFYKPEQKETA